MAPPGQQAANTEKRKDSSRACSSGVVCGQGISCIMNQTPRRLETPNTASLESHSPDGRVSFTLRTLDGGLYAERHETDPAVGRLVQSVVFRDEASFVRWCEADNAKFEYPLVCARIRRKGCDLFAGTGSNSFVAGDLVRS